ncbi:MAG TPA: serine/threonine-protein kinase [Terriglobales bacterium]|nr:serine/threonine-protein kinase [Terriglobales bacterium]
MGRFVPGTLLAARYRIVALLGRGGMGEVYRADDLTLGQPVALKFLSELTAHDEASLERFHNEVRIARRISHPNVCRLYDIGEAEGLTFLSMEYVDGEDLGSLLRRIGRLPSDKALEIARKLCAGLAAAHGKGVLHRDLKPANIMLNSEGEVVIMDFGLADLAEHIPHEQIRYGTPAYMAPEQLAGKEVTAKSDIYSLGLVFYEIFTGKRAFQADTLADIVRTRSESPAPANPSTLVRDLDPGVERVILRCLEADPALRPVSVLAVAAALPGGDPLAAALAAGETPSPQMVAAAGEVEALPARIAVPCLAVFVLGLILSYFLGVRESIYDKMTLEQSPDVLTHRAQEIAAGLGYNSASADTASGFNTDSQYGQYAKDHDKPRPNWDDLLKKGPPILRFWYRSSPQPLVAHEYTESALIPGIVSEGDPPFITPGMIFIFLDMDGRLISFEVIPPEKEDKSEGAKPVDWSPLFTAAGLDAKQLTPSDPIWNSLSASDTRAAWTGTWPGSTRPLRVEAAALHGKPVRFALYGPWTPAWRENPNPSTSSQRAGTLILIIVVCAVLAGAIVFAYRNYSAGRSDPKGAFRLALFIFVMQMAIWIFRAHFVLSIGTFGTFVLSLSNSLFWAVVIAVLYLGLEPYVRKRWPNAIISWSRLLLGRWRDPLVGRDVLFGLVLGIFWAIFLQIFIAYLIRVGAIPQEGNPEMLLGIRHTLGGMLLIMPGDIQATLLFFSAIFLLRIFLRNEWIAAAAFVLIFSVMQSLRNEYFWTYMTAFLTIYSLAAFALVRFGLVSLASAFVLIDLLLNTPMTANFSHWFIGATIFVHASVAVLALFAFYTALAGQKLWKEELFE